MDAYGAMEWPSHGEPRAWRCSDDAMVAAKQNAPLPWLGKRGKRVGVEEVTMAEPLAQPIGKWCGDDSERAQRSDGDGASARCYALLWRGREKSEARE